MRVRRLAATVDSMAEHHDHGHDGHAHDDDHDGHRHGGGHVHAPSAGADRRWLAVALALIAGFMVVEVVAGMLAGSLALLSDAAHMLTDAASIGLALVAAASPRGPPPAPTRSASAAPRSSRPRSTAPRCSSSPA